MLVSTSEFAGRRAARCGRGMRLCTRLFGSKCGGIFANATSICFAWHILSHIVATSCWERGTGEYLGQHGQQRQGGRQSSDQTSGDKVCSRMKQTSLDLPPCGLGQLMHDVLPGIAVLPFLNINMTASCTFDNPTIHAQ